MRSSTPQTSGNLCLSPGRERIAPLCWQRVQLLLDMCCLAYWRDRPSIPAPGAPLAPRLRGQDVIYHNHQLDRRVKTTKYSAAARSTSAKCIVQVVGYNLEQSAQLSDALYEARQITVPDLHQPSIDYASALEVLEIIGCNYVDPAMIDCLSQLFPRLVRVTVHDCVKLSHEWQSSVNRIGRRTTHSSYTLTSPSQESAARVSSVNDNRMTDWQFMLARFDDRAALLLGFDVSVMSETLCHVRKR